MIFKQTNINLAEANTAVFRRKSINTCGRIKRRILLYLYLLKSKIVKLPKCNFDFVFNEVFLFEGRHSILSLVILGYIFFQCYDRIRREPCLDGKFFYLS